MGYGERQGADFGRPEIQGCFVFQWQLDKAPGVVPAQFIVSAVEGRRTALVRTLDVPLCTAAPPGCPASASDPALPNQTVFQNAFPKGAQVSGNRYGWTTELQLPTRDVTVITKYWTCAGTSSAACSRTSTTRVCPTLPDRSSRAHPTTGLPRSFSVSAAECPRLPRNVPCARKVVSSTWDSRCPEPSRLTPPVATLGGRSTCTTSWTSRAPTMSANLEASARKTTWPRPPSISS
jgi:hypothetical protein